MDVTDSYHRFSSTVYAFCERLKRDTEETGIHCTVGIGSNMLLSKIAMDIEAKHTEDGIAEWRYQDIPDKLWPIQPLRDFWGINKRTEAKLIREDIYNWRFSTISLSPFKERFWYFRRRYAFTC